MAQTENAQVRPCFGCKHQHDPDASGHCWEVPCVPECKQCDHKSQPSAEWVSLYSLMGLTDQQ